MKTLILVRHAKSSWKEASIADFDRPLNKRGKRDAPLMAKRLQAIVPSIDRMISSDAKRAYDTARQFSKQYEKIKVKTEENLYLASSKRILRIVNKLDDKHDTIALFAHNPGITSAINFLANKSILNVPTCGLAVIQFDVDSWSDITTHGELIKYDYPKNID